MPRLSVVASHIFHGGVNGCCRRRLGGSFKV